jgi:hypothetical protein
MGRQFGRDPLRERRRLGKPYAGGAAAELFAILALKTGIAPRELLNTPPDILQHMIRYIVPRPPNDWDALADLEIPNG